MTRPVAAIRTGLGHFNTHIGGTGHALDQDDLVDAQPLPQRHGDIVPVRQVPHLGRRRRDALPLGQQAPDQGGEAHADRIGLGDGIELHDLFHHQGAQDVEAGAGVQPQAARNGHRAGGAARLDQEFQDPDRIGRRFDEDHLLGDVVGRGCGVGLSLDVVVLAFSCG